MNTIPDRFARVIVELHGPAGAEWLKRLPALIVACERRWSLSVLPPFSGLSYNYVAPAVRCDGTPTVLKLGFPNRELRTEIAALRQINGDGIVQLLDADPDQGALLLEHLKPGTSLSSLPDDVQATSIAAQVMRRIWRAVPPEHAFPSITEWADGLRKLRLRYGGTTGPFPTSLVEEAEALFSELTSSMAELMLLHGDLHHDNILAAERQPWLAIDPKGVVGEPAYEVGALLRNPGTRLLAEPQPGRILARRVYQLAEELGFERARLRGWALAQAVLAAWWSLEDHGHGWERGLAYAELLAEVQV
jgi:streptomycin 6-kinase